jgi:hypothetical protein
VTSGAVLALMVFVHTSLWLYSGVLHNSPSFRAEPLGIERERVSTGACQHSSASAMLVEALLNLLTQDSHDVQTRRAPLSCNAPCQPLGFISCEYVGQRTDICGDDAYL